MYPKETHSIKGKKTVVKIGKIKNQKSEYKILPFKKHQILYLNSLKK